MVGERHPDALGLPAAPHVAEASAEDGAPGGGALAGQSLAARIALTAGDVERDDDAIADLHRAHRGAGLLHDAHELVAHQRAGLHEGAAAAAVVLVQVGAAHGAGGDAQEDVGRVDQPGIGHIGGPHVAHAVEGDRFHRDSSGRPPVS